MSLITAFEVLKYSPAGFDYPASQFCELIPQIEEEFARECLGPDLYDYLIEKKNPYPAGAKAWDKKSTYALGDTAIRNGCLFVSQVDCNEADPLKETDDWKVFEKFTDADANTFWKSYLRRILALKVYMASLIYTTWKGGAGGIVIASGDRTEGSTGNRAANKGEIFDTKTALIAEIERAAGNMRFWLRKNGKEAGFPVDFVCREFCETPGRRKRRWNFRD